MPRIYTSRKLEKLIKKLIQPDTDAPEAFLGPWNATVFYVDRKKCWLLTHKQTQYNVVLHLIDAIRLQAIDKIFLDILHAQLKYDGIKIKKSVLKAAIGDMHFLPTDNDRRMMGFQNHRLQELEYWKYHFERLEYMPFGDLCHNMNSGPISHPTGQRGGYTTAIAEMKQLWDNRS